MSDRATILAVDDTPENLRLLEALLTPQGYTLVTASSGREALALVSQARPDLLLVDIVMPEMNGYEVTKAIRANAAWKHLPIIMITATGGADLVRSLEAGADDFVSKPFDQHELLARVRSLIRVKRYHDELADALERQTAVAEVLREVGRATADSTPVLDAVIRHALRLCDADSVGLFRREADGLFHFVAHHGRAIPNYGAWTRAHPIDESGTGVVGRVARAKRSVQIPDIARDPEYPAEAREVFGRDMPLGTGLGVPLLLDGAVIGVISLARDIVRPFDAREIELVELFADQAALAVNNVRLFQTVQRQREELSRFFSPQIAQLITSDEGKRMLEGHRRAVTVVFCDLRGFTAFVESVEPEEMLGVLRQYHGAMGTLIAEHGGTLEHFEGDGFMVFFNDPVEIEHHERAAVRMAIAMRARFDELAAGWRKKGYDLAFGVGIAVGYATLGRIGFEGRYDYAVIGNVTIHAQRLSSAARGGQILVTQRVYAAIEDLVEARSVGELELKGISRPMPAYDIVRMKD